MTLAPRLALGRLRGALAQARTGPMRDRRSLASRVVPEVLDGLGPSDGVVDDGRWTLRVLAHSPDGPLVLLGTRRRGRGPSASFVVKIAGDAAGAVRLEREAAALDVLRAQPGLERWRAAAPTVEAVERRDDALVLVTSRLSGSRPASRGSAAERDALRERALAAIAPLHAATGQPVRPDTEHAGTWVLGPAARVGAAARHAGMTAVARSLARLGDAVVASLEDGAPIAGIVHGDYWPDNLLVDAMGRVSGIVDWESAAVRGSPLVDVLGLEIAVLRAGSRRHTGEIVASLLAPTRAQGVARGASGRSLAGHTRDLARARRGAVEAACSAAGMTTRDGLVVAWLAALDGSLARRPSLARNRSWLARNVEPVIATRDAWVPE